MEGPREPLALLAEGLREPEALPVKGLREPEACLELTCLLASVFGCLHVSLLLWLRVVQVLEVGSELWVQPGMQAVQFQQVSELCQAVGRLVAAERSAVCHPCC